MPFGPTCEISRRHPSLDQNAKTIAAKLISNTAGGINAFPADVGAVDDPWLEVTDAAEVVTGGVTPDTSVVCVSAALSTDA